MPFKVNLLRSPVLYRAAHSVGHHTKCRAAIAAESKERSVLRSLYLVVMALTAAGSKENSVLRSLYLVVIAMGAW